MGSNSSDDGGYYDNYSDNSSEDDNKEEDQTLELMIEKLNLGPKKNKLIVLSLNGLLIHRAHKSDNSSIPANRCPDGVYNNGNKLGLLLLSNFYLYNKIKNF